MTRFNLVVSGNQSALGKVISVLPMDSVIKCEVFKGYIHLIIKCEDPEIINFVILLETIGCSVSMSLLRDEVTEVKDFALFRKNVWGLYKLQSMLETGIKANSKEYSSIKEYYKYCPLSCSDMIMERTGRVSREYLPLSNQISNVKFIACKCKKGCKFLEKVSPEFDSLEECKMYVKQNLINENYEIEYATVSYSKSNGGWNPLH